MSKKKGRNVYFQAKIPYNPYNLKKNPYNQNNFRTKKNKIRTISTFWPP